MEHNEINIQGGMEISRAMQNKASLLTLNLNGNNFGEDGIEKIKQNLSKSGRGDALQSFRYKSIKQLLDKYRSTIFCILLYFSEDEGSEEENEEDNDGDEESSEKDSDEESNEPEDESQQTCTASGDAALPSVI